MAREEGEIHPAPRIEMDNKDFGIGAQILTRSQYYQGTPAHQFNPGEARRHYGIRPWKLSSTSEY